MAIVEIFIDTFSKADLSMLSRIEAKHGREKKCSGQELDFESWYNGESQRQYADREALKTEGWALVRDLTLGIEERVRGAEMICYAHWHRAHNAKSFPIDLLEYAGCWVDATAPRLFSSLQEELLLTKLRQRYPLKSKRRLEPGYTYVWRIQ